MKKDENFIGVGPDGDLKAVPFSDQEVSVTLVLQKTGEMLTSSQKTETGYDFYEVKFFNSPMTLKECEGEELQVRSIVNLICRRIGFICSSGFDFSDDRYGLISGKDLFDLQ